MNSRWKDRAWCVVAALDAACPKDMSQADYRHALRAAYPFEVREFWPYKAWLEVQRMAIERRFPEQSRPSRQKRHRKPQDKDQLELEMP